MTKHSLSHRILDEQIRNKANNYKHPTYVTEHRLLEAIRNGKTDAAIRYLDEINSIERPTLADHPLRSLKNNLISRCTLCARAAIQGGAVAETSFILADILIRDVEEQVSITKLEALEYDLVQYFVELVAMSRHESYSTPVNKAIRYIRENLQQRLTLKDIAREADVSPNYLSNLFSREVSEPPISFYNRERNQAIKTMLADSNLSMSDIAKTFNFSSVSYFSTAFRKENGITPTQYRRQRSWATYDASPVRPDEQPAGEQSLADSGRYDEEAGEQPERAAHTDALPQDDILTAASEAGGEQSYPQDTAEGEIAELEKAISADTAAAEEAAGISTKKRRRGRPRKQVQQENTDAGTETASEAEATAAVSDQEAAEAEADAADEAAEEQENN